MDEKELIQDIKWDFSQGKSRAEVTRSLQKRGFKLEFIESLLSKANKPRRILKNVLVSFLVLVSLWFGIYGVFFYHPTERMEYTPTWITENIGEFLEQDSSGVHSINITPELISLFLSEIGATKLRVSPISLTNPVIGIDISGKLYYSIIGKKINTFEGYNKGIDIMFKLKKETIEEIFLSQDFKDSVKKEVISGDITLEKHSSEHELFLKGYLTLYNELK